MGIWPLFLSPVGVPLLMNGSRVPVGVGALGLPTLADRGCISPTSWGVPGILSCHTD